MKQSEKDITPSRSAEYTFLFGLLLYPFAGVDESLDPRGHLVVSPVGGIVAALPREDSPFEVRHHGQVTTVGRSDAGDAIGRPVGVGRVSVVGILGYDVVALFGIGQFEFAFAVGYPF